MRAVALPAVASVITIALAGCAQPPRMTLRDFLACDRIEQNAALITEHLERARRSGDHEKVARFETMLSLLERRPPTCVERYAHLDRA